MVERIIMFLIKIFGLYQESETIDISYCQKPIMSKYENEFYNKMKELEQDYKIVPQLVLSSVIKKESKNKYQNELYKMIDFAIFDKDYNKLLLLIEINDSSHNQTNRKERDLKVKKICNNANIKLITFYTKYPNEKDYIINRIKKEIEK